MTKRNEPCHCGSNIKFKRCCGRPKEIASPQELNELGCSHFEQNNIEEAIRCFQKAIFLDPSPSIYYNLARAYYQKKTIKEAIKVLRIAQEKEPGNIQISDLLIKILNDHSLDIEPNFSYIIAQKSLQQIDNSLEKSGKINTASVKKIYKQIEDILLTYSLNNLTNETQIYRGKIIHTNCSRHRMVFDKFEIIPEYCFGCYKITIEPRNVLELFKLFLVFINIELPNDNSRKCMIETREEIAGAYKGIIYCKSFEDGKHILNITQQTVKERIGDKIPIYIKRGCSEFSLFYPTYDSIQDNNTQQLEYIEEWRKHEVYADKNLIKYDEISEDFTHSHPGFTLRDSLIMRQWLEYAFRKGDSTYLDIV